MEKVISIISEWLYLPNDQLKLVLIASAILCSIFLIFIVICAAEYIISFYLYTISLLIYLVFVLKVTDSGFKSFLYLLLNFLVCWLMLFIARIISAFKESFSEYLRKQIKSAISKEYTVDHIKMKYKMMLVKGYAFDILLLCFYNFDMLFYIALTLGVILFIVTLIIVNEFKHIDNNLERKMLNG